MDKLPGELILHIASYLVLERDEPQETLPPNPDVRMWEVGGRLRKRIRAQRTLAAFVRTRKKIAVFANPLLRRSPILTSHDKAEAWARSFASAEPFALAKSVHPANLGTLVTSPVSFSPADPPSIDIPLAFGLLDHLTSICLEEVHLGSDFLPRLVGPGTSGRRRIRSLRISKCTPAPCNSTEQALSFLLDELAFFTPDGVEENLPEDADDIKPTVFSILELDGPTLVHHDDPLSALDEEEQAYAVLDRCRTNYALFSELWTPWTYLHLIFNTLNFPSLRNLQIDDTGSFFSKIWPGELLNELLPAMRMSISRPPSSARPSTPWRFRAPCVDDDVFDDIQEYVVADEGPAPGEKFFFKPLSKKEEKEHFPVDTKHEYRPYKGPRLDWLDMDGVSIVYGEAD
ncbi:hypothetical protein JCM8097_008128 [Rhodosporidiobolus ruineniae]